MMLFIPRILIGLLFALPLLVFADSYGEFVGTVKAEWLDDGRKMRLLEDFAYVDQWDHRWNAPKNWVVDGASIPRFAWTIIGGPFEGKYRNASVVHDVECDRKQSAWEDVHEMFYNAMRAAGVSEIRAKIMYAAVYHFGPRWGMQYSEVVDSSKYETVIAQVNDRHLGSDIEISTSEKSRTVFEFMTFQPKKLDLRISATPRANKLSQAEFEKLRAKIELGELDLEGIQNYKP